MANSKKEPPVRKPTRYQIRLNGIIRENWSDWLSGMEISTEQDGEESPVTTLVGFVTDQAALRGILCKIWDLNLTILSVDRIEMKAGEKVDKENE